ncbi:hypothetical protein M231_04144 [Tremella mesenterica]|uniref:Uncharacterized protein n=1 Tax=Tremella mesenterica TaxID=5217 RepID=A0A4Q1BLH2_TREME|nr:hypothetical protein M231_04144 [Tremella mesenterica]
MDVDGDHGDIVDDGMDFDDVEPADVIDGDEIMTDDDGEDYDEYEMETEVEEPIEDSSQVFPLPNVVEGNLQVKQVADESDATMSPEKAPVIETSQPPPLTLPSKLEKNLLQPRDERLDDLGHPLSTSDVVEQPSPTVPQLLPTLALPASQSQPYPDPTTETLTLEDQVMAPRPKTSLPLDSLDLPAVADIRRQPPDSPVLAQSGATQENAESVGGYEDEDGPGEEDAEYPLDVQNLPPIILHLPDLGARVLFSPLADQEVAGGLTLPVWLKNRQEDLGTATLDQVWKAIREEMEKEGLTKPGVMVIAEKQMDLVMYEDDKHLNQVTLLVLLQLHRDCDLPTPVQFFVSFDAKRFYSRLTAIQQALNGQQVSEKATQQPASKSDQPSDSIPPKRAPTLDAEEPDEYDGEYTDEEAPEESVRKRRMDDVITPDPGVPRERNDTEARARYGDSRADHAPVPRYVSYPTPDSAIVGTGTITEFRRRLSEDTPAVSLTDVRTSDFKLPTEFQVPSPRYPSSPRWARTEVEELPLSGDNVEDVHTPRGDPRDEPIPEDDAENDQPDEEFGERAVLQEDDSSDLDLTTDSKDLHDKNQDLDWSEMTPFTVENYQDPVDQIQPAGQNFDGLSEEAPPTPVAANDRRERQPDDPVPQNVEEVEQTILTLDPLDDLSEEIPTPVAAKKYDRDQRQDPAPRDEGESDPTLSSFGISDDFSDEARYPPASPNKERQPIVIPAYVEEAVQAGSPEVSEDLAAEPVVPPIERRKDEEEGDRGEGADGQESGRDVQENEGHLQEDEVRGLQEDEVRELQADEVRGLQENEAEAEEAEAEEAEAEEAEAEAKAQPRLNREKDEVQVGKADGQEYYEDDEGYEDEEEEEAGGERDGERYQENIEYTPPPSDGGEYEEARELTPGNLPTGLQTPVTPPESLDLTPKPTAAAEAVDRTPPPLLEQQTQTPLEESSIESGEQRLSAVEEVDEGDLGEQDDEEGEADGSDEVRRNSSEDAVYEGEEEFEGNEDEAFDPVLDDVTSTTSSATLDPPFGSTSLTGGSDPVETDEWQPYELRTASDIDRLSHVYVPPPSDKQLGTPLFAQLNKRPPSPETASLNGGSKRSRSDRTRKWFHIVLSDVDRLASQ